LKKIKFSKDDLRCPRCGEQIVVTLQRLIPVDYTFKFNKDGSLSKKPQKIYDCEQGHYPCHFACSSCNWMMNNEWIETDESPEVASRLRRIMDYVEKECKY
jgi:hypothetical protein